MKAHKLMLIPDLKKIIEEMSCIQLRIKKNGDFYKHVLWLGKKKHIIREKKWIAVTFEETLVGISPTLSVLYAHNQLCNAAQGLQNAWLKVGIFMRRNRLPAYPPLDDFSILDDPLKHNLLHSGTLFAEMRGRMTEVVDYVFFNG